MPIFHHPNGALMGLLRWFERLNGGFGIERLDHESFHPTIRCFASLCMKIQLQRHSDGAERLKNLICTV